MMPAVMFLLVFPSDKLKIFEESLFVAVLSSRDSSNVHPKVIEQVFQKKHSSKNSFLLLRPKSEWSHYLGRPHKYTKAQGSEWIPEDLKR